MTMLSKSTGRPENNFHEALNKLKEAIKLLEQYKYTFQPLSLYEKLLAITYNNIACYYKLY